MHSAIGKYTYTLNILFSDVILLFLHEYYLTFNTRSKMKKTFEIGLRYFSNTCFCELKQPITLSIIKMLRMLKIISSRFTLINLCLHTGALSTHCVQTAGKDLIGSDSGKLVTCFDNRDLPLHRNLSILFCDYPT